MHRSPFSKKSVLYDLREILKNQNQKQGYVFKLISKREQDKFYKKKIPLHSTEMWVLLQSCYKLVCSLIKVKNGMLINYFIRKLKRQANTCNRHNRCQYERFINQWSFWLWQQFLKLFAMWHPFSCTCRNKQNGGIV